jgi:hypothetical protein
VEGSVTLYDEAGHVAMQCTGLRLQLLDQLGAGSLDDWLYEEQWESAPRPTGAASPPAGVLAEKLEPFLDVRASEQRFAEYYSSVEPALNTLTAGFVHEALAELGLAAARDGGLAGDALADRLGVVPPQRRFFARLLEIAASSEEAPRALPDDLDGAYPGYRCGSCRSCTATAHCSTPTSPPSPRRSRPSRRRWGRDRCGFWRWGPGPAAPPG